MQPPINGAVTETLVPGTRKETGQGGAPVPVTEEEVIALNEPGPSVKATQAVAEWVLEGKPDSSCPLPGWGGL